jgi:hypothetical protein
LIYGLWSPLWYFKLVLLLDKTLLHCDKWWNLLENQLRRNLQHLSLFCLETEPHIQICFVYNSFLISICQCQGLSWSWSYVVVEFTTVQSVPITIKVVTLNPVQEK